MQKKFLVLFLFAAALFGVSAQDKSKPVPDQPYLNGNANKNELAKYTVATRLFEPPRIKKIHDPSVKEYAGKLKHLIKKKEATSSWGFLHTSFPVLSGGGKVNPWGEWLDGVVVTADLIVKSSSRKDDGYYVLRGVQKLNAVHADGEIHDVAFFVPPYALHRYYKLESDPSRNNLKALEDALAASMVRFTIECGSYKTCIYNYGTAGKNASDKKIRARIDELISGCPKENIVDDCLVNIRETPWIIMGVEFFESVKADKAGGK